MYEVLKVCYISGKKSFTIIDYSDFVVEVFEQDVIEKVLKKGIKIKGLSLGTLDKVSVYKEVMFKGANIVLIKHEEDDSPTESILQIKNRRGDVLFTIRYLNYLEDYDAEVACEIHMHKGINGDEFLEIRFRYLDKYYGPIGQTFSKSCVLYCVGGSQVKPILTEAYYMNTRELKPIGFIDGTTFSMRGTLVKSSSIS